MLNRAIPDPPSPDSYGIDGRDQPRLSAMTVSHDVRFYGADLAAACRPCRWRAAIEPGHTTAELMRLDAQHGGQPSVPAGRRVSTARVLLGLSVPHLPAGEELASLIVSYREVLRDLLGLLAENGVR